MQNTKKSLNVMAIAIGLVLGSLALTHAGEKGCSITPGDLKGQCLKNTENTYSCIPAYSNKNCTAS